MAKCCGGGGSTTDYLVTFRDGTEKRFTTMAEARIAVGADTSEGAKAPTVRAVPKLAK